MTIVIGSSFWPNERIGPVPLLFFTLENFSAEFRCRYVGSPLLHYNAPTCNNFGGYEVWYTTQVLALFLCQLAKWHALLFYEDPMMGPITRLLIPTMGPLIGIGENRRHANSQSGTIGPIIQLWVPSMSPPPSYGTHPHSTYSSYGSLYVSLIKEEGMPL